MAMGRVVPRAAAVATVIATAGLWVLGLVLAGMDGNLVRALGGVGGLGFAIVGALVVWQRPDNRLGWIFCAAALAMTVLGAGGEYAKHAVVYAPGSLPDGRLIAWLADAMALPTVGLLAGVIPQLFPSGRPISPRWRIPLWAAFAYILFGTVGNAFIPQHLESVSELDNPYAIGSARPICVALIGASAIFGAMALVGSIASLTIRWRRSHGDERQQLKWFLTGALLPPVPLLLHDATPTVSDLGVSVALVIIPTTLGVAVLRHRLYELDLVVRRALVYAVVSALVAGLYVAIVAVAELAVGRAAGLGVHVLAAVAAAAGFQPLRSLLQHAVDRLFFGDRPRPYDALSALARRLEVAIDPDTVLPGVVDSIGHASRLPHVAIQLHEAGDWRVAAQRGEPAAVPVNHVSNIFTKLSVADRAQAIVRAREAGLGHSGITAAGGKR